MTRGEDEQWLLYVMGFETANVHLGTKNAGRVILQHLSKAEKGWLKLAATNMQQNLMSDFKRWTTG